MNTLRTYLQYVNFRTVVMFVAILALLVSIFVQTRPVDAVSAAAYATARCKTTTIVGHRGATAPGIRNNSLAAFKYAVASGAKVVEFDIHRTKSGKGGAQWVVYHDKKIKGHTISKTSYKTLKKLEPTLTTYRQAMSYLRTVGNVRVFAEIKPSKVSKGSLKYIGRVISQYGMKNRTEIHSFNKPVLQKFRKYVKGVRTGFIMNKVKYSATTIRSFAQSVVINKSLIFGKKVSVSALRAKGLAVYAYTPNTSSDWTSLMVYGVSGVITDYSKSFATWCKAIQPKPVVKPAPKPPVAPVPPTPPVVPTPPVPPVLPVDPVPGDTTPEDPSDPNVA